MTREFENELIEAVLRGSVDSFEPLVTEYQKPIYNLALRMTGSAEDAADLTQEVFIKAYKNLSGFRGESKFSVWLYRIAANVCTDFLRSQSRRDSVSLSMDDDESGAEYEIPDLRLSPEAELDKRLIRESLAEGLESLPPEQRKILLLREIDGLSYEEIAQTLELEAGTVKSRIFRARKKLCEFLLKSGNLPDGIASTYSEGGAEK